MPELSRIDPGSAALLVMDYQVDALTKFMTAAQSADAIACVPHLIATARDAEHDLDRKPVVVASGLPGHALGRPCNPVFSAPKGKRMMVAGRSCRDLSPAAAAWERRTARGQSTARERSMASSWRSLLAQTASISPCQPLAKPAAFCSRTLATSAIWIIVVVIRECCADLDAELHTMLLDGVIARQAAVVTHSRELVGALPGKSL